MGCRLTINYKAIDQNSPYFEYPLLKEICTEPMPDDIIEQITQNDMNCFVESPQAKTGRTFSNYKDGWGYSCWQSSTNYNPYFDWIFLWVFAILMYLFLLPLVFIALPILFLIYLFAYAVITLYTKQRAINYYLLPIFYGLIGGIIAAFINRKDWKKYILIGIIENIILLVLAYIAGI